MEVAVGIDLGTTFSAVASLDESGTPRILPNSEGDASTPSIVYFHDAGVVVGKEAAKVARFEPDAVAPFAKRDMGKAEYHRPVRGRRVPPEVIQALILRQLKEDASLKLGEFSRAVITVPAYFNEPRRKATMDAGRLAGLEVLDIINEPTAAAIAYGIREGFLAPGGSTPRDQQILVYDLGGGTFDVTLMEICGMHYRAVATDGDVFLGGIDWDQRIADYAAEQFLEQHGVDPREDPAARQSLLQDAEDAKRALSSRASVAIHVSYEGRRASVTLTAAQLEQLTADLLDRTIFTVTNLLRESRRKWSDLTRILLVGGSSRMPVIRRALEQESGMAVDRSLLSEEPVAMGAALYAGMLLGHHGGERPRTQILNCSSHPLGVLGVERKTKLPRRKILIPRNTPLPAEGLGSFTTFRADQRNVLVSVVEGGDDSGRNATPIGQCIVSDLPPGLPVGTRVRVKFAYGTNGRLTVTAGVPGILAQVAMAVERASGLSPNALEQWRGWIEAGAVLQAEPVREEPQPPPVDAPLEAPPLDSSPPADPGEMFLADMASSSADQIWLPDGPPAEHPADPGLDQDLERFLRGLH